MTKKNLFRRVMDSMIEGRSRQAQRYIDQYLKDHRRDAARVVAVSSCDREAHALNECARHGETISIRDAMAFPKTQAGTDPLFGAPSEVSEAQLRDLHIAIMPVESPAK